jgi:hypothetical protein
MDERVLVMFALRDDGGLRAWSDDVPGLVLSHKDPNKVIADVAPALSYMLSCKYGCLVQVHAEEPLPEPITRAAAAAAAHHKAKKAAQNGRSRESVVTYAAEPCYG